MSRLQYSPPYIYLRSHPFCTHAHTPPPCPFRPLTLTPPPKYIYLSLFLQLYHFSGIGFPSFLPFFAREAAANVPLATSRPGILVLINDADWELEGEEAYELQSGDNILFVSTLHGG